MGVSLRELERWQDWTHPDYFSYHEADERRFLPLFMRQLSPRGAARTKLTLAGWVLVVVSLGIGTAAYNAASNILFMTLSLLLSVLVLSGLLSTINFRKLNLRLEAPRHLRVKEPGKASIYVENGKRVFPSMSLRFHTSGSDEAGDHSVYLMHALGPGQGADLEWTFLPQRRGEYSLELRTMESRFPFGFIRRMIPQQLSERFLVWPERVEVAFQPATSGHRQAVGVPRKALGQGSDLLNLRRYVAGDAPRMIHWKASARMGRLMVRQMAQEGERSYQLVVQGAWSDVALERLCAVVASLAEDLYHAARLDSVVVGEETHRVRTLRDLHEVLDALALVTGEQLAGGVRSAANGLHRVDFYAVGEAEVAIYVDGQAV